MSPTPPALPEPKLRPDAPPAERVIRSLAGVISARVIEEEAREGAIEAIHVLASEGRSPDRIASGVRSALLAHLDLVVSRDRISVVSTRIRSPGTTSPEAPGDPEGPAPPSPEAKLCPPPWPERRLRGSEKGEREEEAVDASLDRVRPDHGGAVDEETAFRKRGNGGKNGRLVFLGHRASEERSDGVRLEVDVGFKGHRYNGRAFLPTGRDTRLRVGPAATLDAIRSALEHRPPDSPTSAVSVELQGVEMVEALGMTHVMVVVEAEFEGARIPLVGSVAMHDSVEVASILATLRATDRRIRAVL